MFHFPINHHLRPLYRFLTVLTALYVLTFGIVGLVKTSGGTMFDRAEVTALGLRTNLAFSLASIVVGAAILVAVFVGRNVDAMTALVGGVIFMLVGTVMMAVLDSDLNVLNFSIGTVVVSFGIGLVLATAGMYIQSGPSQAAEAEEATRHGGH